MKKLKQKEGITLIALIITIIVLLILAGVTISMLTGENSILRNAKLAAEETRGAAVEEKVMLWKTEIMLAQSLGGTADGLNEILDKLENEGLLTGEERAIIEAPDNERKEITIGSKTISFNTEYVPPEDPVIVVDRIKDGSWNEEEKVNTPNLENTGLIPIYFDESGNTVELTDASTDDEWDKWYDYENNEWANAITKDENNNITGYFVWIPRFAYKITSNLGKSGANVSGTILVKFLQGTTINDEDGSAEDTGNAGDTITKTYPTVTNNAMANYVVHPSFTDGTANKWQNGEWDEEIAGFWVAKYEAGFQKSTTDTAGNIINETDTVVYSIANKYTSYYPDYTTNALGQTLTQAGYANEYLSYPVFNPLTYAYNVISTGDSYTISKEIQSASHFYGLANIDSHMMKNSEWGAVAYLTQSEYGRAGTEVTINDKNLNNLNSKIIYAVTGYEGENTPLGVNASSTGNITGVFDLSGGTWERTAGYITNKNANLSYGSNYAYDDTAETNPETRSTKWATAYPYVSTDTSAANWTNFNNNFKKTRFGDAILEVSSAGGGAYGWNGDYSYSPYSIAPFFARGGRYGSGLYAGSFAFSYSYYPDNISGFRAVLIPETVNN